MNISRKIISKIKSIKSLSDLSSVSKTFITGRILKKRMEWNIAFIRKNWKINFNKKKITKIHNPKNRWFADPFVIKQNKFHYIFFEDYNLINKKGSISCIKVDKQNKVKHYNEIIKEKFHLSFPFIFKYNKNYFMIPEARESRSIRLYKCSKFPNKWKFFKKIMSHIDYVDPIIFKWKNSWILTFSKAKNEFLYNKLCVYTSKNPLSTNWKPLSSNPVIVSDIFGRNAGLIQESNKKIYRIGQAYLPGNYGAFISVNKILNISEKKYQEKKIKKILPPNKKYMSGIHTLNYVKNFTVFDYSKWVK
jgi:hypothetical protein